MTKRAFSSPSDILSMVSLKSLAQALSPRGTAASQLALLRFNERKPIQVTSDLNPVIAHCRSVYRYWREQGFSPQDSRVMVGSYLFSYYGHQVPA